MRRQPFLSGGDQRLICQIRPGIAFHLPHPANPRTGLPCRFIPGQVSQAALSHGLSERRGHGSRVRLR